MVRKNRFNKNYWLRKIYTSKFFQILPLNKNFIKKKIFTSIYESKHWVQDDDMLPKEYISVSGHGSNINTEQFFNLSKNFNEIIELYKIKSILDMPCGDFMWIKKIVKDKKIKYLGIDIVDQLIDDNNKKYQSQNINFLCYDIVDFKTNQKFFEWWWDINMVRRVMTTTKWTEV